MIASQDTAQLQPSEDDHGDRQRDTHRRAASALRKVWEVPGLSTEQRIQHARGLNLRLRELEIQMGLAELSSFPSIVELPVAGNCNLRCEMCSLSHGAPTYKFWGVADAERFSELFKYSQLVNPTGVGEPLMGREFFPMLELFKQHGNAVGFYTNATLLNAAKIDRLIDLGIEQINVSLDGATAETFERIRIHAKFDAVINNVRNLIARRRERGADKPAVQIAMVLMKDNIHELPILVRLAHDLGANSVYAGFVAPITAAFIPRMPAKDPARTNSFLEEARRLGQELGLRIWVPALLPEPGSSGEAPVSPPAPRPAPGPMAKGRDYCSYPWTQYLVHNDGGVAPCCQIRGQMDDQSFGNIADGPPEKLWNSPGMIRLRERLINGEPPAICRNCTVRTSSIS